MNSLSALELLICSSSLHVKLILPMILKNRPFHKDSNIDNDKINELVSEVT